MMDKENNYDETEKVVISYGMELLLNSVLKTVIHLLNGIVVGKGLEVTCAVVIFACIRKISGGRHATTNIGCFVMTGGIVFWPLIVWILLIFQCRSMKYYLQWSALFLLT